jgi:hypothetical protein
MNKSVKLHVYAALAAGLMLLPIAAHAQASPAATAGGTTTASDATRTDTDRHDYGWIGLAGLLGLAGLMGRKRDGRYSTASSGTTRSDVTSTRS